MNTENYLDRDSQVLTPIVTHNAAQRAATEIRGLMGARRLGAADLASVIDVSASTAKRRMAGESDLTLNELEAIAKWLGVTVARIIAPPADAGYSK